MLFLPIIYEDQYVVVVNKPAGLVVHGDGRTNESALTDWVLERYPDTERVGEPLRINGKEFARPGIVHRLDRETSGVIVIAKNQEAFLYFKKQFQERKITKTYRAFVHGVLKEREGVIECPIGRSAKDFRLLSAQHGAKGVLREATTAYTVLKTNDAFSYLTVRPKTGRTHQIRVHLKAISRPIVCDKLYAPKRPCALGFNRLALHAFSLTFTVPNGCVVIVEAPLPDDFEQALKLLG